MLSKAAVLDLNADNQGLLLPRITDTTAINALNPADGMVIYFVPLKCLLLRTLGYWAQLSPSGSSFNVGTGSAGNDFSITGSPVTMGSTLTLNLPSASDANRGLLTPADWNTFNNKQAALTFGNLTTTTTGMTVTGGTSAVVGSGATVNIQNATTSQNGLLTSTDWNTFNNKVNTTRTISTTAPLTGGGDLSANRTLSMTQANTSTNGWLSSTDWNTFNNKVGTTRTINTTAPLTGGGDLSANRTLSMTQANTSTNGWLSSTDWNTFNSKQAALTMGNLSTSTAGVTVLGGTGAVIGGGASINIQDASTSQTGLLTAADWNTFNSKQAPLTMGNLTTATSGVTVSGGSGAVIGAGAAINIQNATTSQNGLLTSADWNTFNSKQAAGNYLTALSGDVTAAGPGAAAATIANGAVTYAKMQNVSATGRLWGRASAGAGTVEELLLGTGLSFSGTTLQVSSLPNTALANSTIGLTLGSTGTDATVTGSPAALGGSLTLNLPSASTTARGLLTAADWNTFNNKVSTTGTINTTAPLTGGGDLSANRTLSMTQANSTTNGWLSTADWNTFNNKGSGTVTSVGLSMPSIFTVSNSPVTTSGTLTAALASQTQNTVFAAPNGAAGVPSFRSLVKADLPATVVYNDQANTYTAGMKQTFRGNATNSGIGFGGLTADPTTLVSGDLWYRSDVGKFRYFNGTTSQFLATEGVSISGTANYLSKFSATGTTLVNSVVYDDGVRAGIGTTAPTAALHVKAASNPLRVEGLRPATTGSVMVVDGSGNVGINTSVQLSFLAKGVFSLNLPNISNNSSVAFTVTVAGAQPGDAVIVTPSAELVQGAGLIIVGYSYVSAADQVTIRFVNTTNTNTDLPAINFYITVLR